LGVPDGEDWQPLSKAADIVGVHRMTLGRWVRTKKLRTRSGQVRNLKTTLVNVEEVRRLVGSGLAPGRPKREGASKRGKKL
jgi:hypothetical protein